MLEYHAIINEKSLTDLMPGSFRNSLNITN